MRRFLLLTVLIIGTASLSQAQSDLTTFILIRHAEKADDGTRDPGLTAEGTARAERLEALLKNTDVSAIYSTGYKRTRSTVAPLATSLGMEIKEYDPRGKAFIDEIMRDFKGGTVVVSGHSNTTPFVANLLLGEQKFQQLDESEYSKIFVVTISEIGKGTVTLLTY